jgi:diguanylate cyclase and metal dependent phosphohydrolase
MQNFKDFEKLSIKLNDTCNATGITRVLEEAFSAVNIYIYDYTSETLRDFSKSWISIDEFRNKEKAKKLYQIFEELKNNNYLTEDNKLYYALYHGQKLIGILEFSEHLNSETLEFLKVASYLISLKIQNVILLDRMQKNIDFHDAMKNIAKIIETQYETSYIIPIIGEMIDKFVCEHLIYIFINNKLVWPSACKDDKIFELLKCLNNKSEYILTPDRKIGLFPLISENKLLGCVVTKSTDNILSEKEISYLEQLTNQAATTINRANVYAEILKHATLDALTGFYNRRQLEERIKQEVSGAKRQKRNLCTIMTDIDYFKNVNDTYGHAAGDLVLKNVSSVIKHQLRDYDIAGRYGGEEFAIILPYTKIEEAQMVAQRLRRAVENTKIDISKVNTDTDEKIIGVTISLGISEYKTGDNEKTLLQKADKALYKAKESGRNRAEVYEEVSTNLS